MSTTPAHFPGQWRRTSPSQGHQFRQACGASVRSAAQNVPAGREWLSRSADDRHRSLAASRGNSGENLQQAAAAASPGDFSPDVCDSPPSYNRAASDTADESMNNHLENLTPPASPEKADSPNNTADNLEQLTLQQNGATSRISRSSAKAAASRPPAALEPGRRNSRVSSPSTLNQAARRAGSRSPRPALEDQQRRRRVEKHQQRVRQRGKDSHPTSAYCNNDSFHQGKTHEGFRNIMPRDSGYETNPSRENTIQTSHAPGGNQRMSNISTSDINRMVTNKAPIFKERTLTNASESRYSLVMQPESSPISQDQLAAEVKGIYAGLVMVESKCINIDAAQAIDLTTDLAPEKWQALIALHRTLLYEHHDFLMATQHPSATATLRALPLRYSMPARMWKHGIHAFLEVLRHRRPESQEYMLAFVYLAYQMMALLYETVPAFLDTWIECLGDLARYRMAIEDEREPHATWGGVAASWYIKASDKHPDVGRLHHHLGILERPGLRKFACYGKSLTSVVPFLNARDSMTTLCIPISEDQSAVRTALRSTEASFCRVFALLFLGKAMDLVDAASSTAFQLLATPENFRWKDAGVPLAIISISALLGFGSPRNPLRVAYDKAIGRHVTASAAAKPYTPVYAPPENADPISEPEEQPEPQLPSTAKSIALAILSYSLRQAADPANIHDVLPYLHTTLCFLHSLTLVQNHYYTAGSFHLLEEVPWGALATFLSHLLRLEPLTQRVEQCARHGVFLYSENGGDSQPLPEDYSIRGLVWGYSAFGPATFDTAQEEGVRMAENDRTRKGRAERVIYYALKLSFKTEFLKFDAESRTFNAAGMGSVKSYNQTFAPGQRTESPPTNSIPALPSPNSLSDPFSSASEGSFVHVRHPVQAPTVKKPAARTWASVASEPRAKHQRDHHRPSKHRHISNDSVKIADPDDMNWEAGA